MTFDIKGKLLAEYASDIQTGIGSFAVSDFGDLQTIGMAASLAIQLRGLPELKYSVLAQVSDARFNIPAIALKNVLRTLSEVGMVKLYEKGRTIEKIDPQIPYFENVFNIMGDYSSEFQLTETEQAMVTIMAQLQSHPKNKDQLVNNIGIEHNLAKRCLTIGAETGLVNSHRVRGQTVLLSPLYFADNNTGLADLLAKVGGDDFSVIMNVIKAHQGWPLSLIIENQRISGTPLSNVQVDLVRMLSSENILKPPTIEIGTFKETFLFTPRPGTARLSAGKRDIYERAMALLSAVRKGQLLPFKYPIRKPAILLEAFLRDGYLRANTEAMQQYGKVAATFNIGTFREIRNGWHEFHLRKTEENIEAVQIAIDLAQGGNSRVEMREDIEARSLLQMDDVYVNSVLGSKKLRERQRVDPSPAAKEQWEQLTLGLV